MTHKNIILLNISFLDRISGVDRYLENLLDAFQEHTEYRIINITFCIGSKIMFSKVKTSATNQLMITIPLPIDFDLLAKSHYWMNRYNEIAYLEIQPYITKDKFNIIHIHTLNLIDFALYIKNRHPSRIITHLHCIPWKNNYNTDQAAFNRLYNKIYVDHNYSIPPSELCTHRSEYNAYLKADAIICVTQCASDYLTKLLKIPMHKVFVVPNGMKDHQHLGYKHQIKCQNELSLLFVGAPTRSKGLCYVLDALSKVKVKESEMRLSLMVASEMLPMKIAYYQKKFPQVNVKFLGRLSFDELSFYYQICDIGIIASLQEQCSYAAIEMAMYGLPIITTAVDGLDEMFQDRKDAIKVPATFSRLNGLSIDTDAMAESIIELGRNKELRSNLSFNVRKTFCDRFRVEIMLEKTLLVYNA